jgi:hypothetical protein
MNLLPPAWGTLVTEIQAICEISLKLGPKGKPGHELYRKNDMLDSETMVIFPRWRADGAHWLTLESWRATGL